MNRCEPEGVTARPAAILAQRWVCLWCEGLWLSHPCQQPLCPQCQGALHPAGLWQIERHAAFPWWMGQWAAGGYTP